MSRIIMLIPIGNNVGLTSISLGVIRSMELKGISSSFFKVIDQSNINGVILDKIATIRKDSNLSTIEPLKISHVEFLLSSNQKDMLLEEIVANYHANNYDTEVVLIQGLISTFKHQFAQLLNFEIANTLNAEIIFVISQNNDTPEKLKERIELASSNLWCAKKSNILGVIVNKVNAPVDYNKHTCPYLYEVFEELSKTDSNKFDPTKMQILITLPLLGVVPWSFDLIATRAIDIARHLNAIIINEGDSYIRRVKSITFCTKNITYMQKYFRTGSILVTSADRHDVIVTACLAVMNGIEISAILLTEGYEINYNINKLCERAFSTGLPVFMVKTNTWQTFLNLLNSSLEIPTDDYERIEKVQEYIARYINFNWIKSLNPNSGHNYRLSPPVFRYQLTELARKANKSIVLPEGDEPRTIKAASICAKRGIATCILLGNPEKINYVATSQGIKLGSGIKIINPESIREHYVSRLVELRKNKGMVDILAREYLKDNIVLGTLMLEKDEVDGLVSGAIHTTANTIRPSLQIIKTAPGNSIVSSIFFMLLPEDVYIYGDCAINPNPNAEQLAEIAIQSSESAILFGIEPRVAMLSYSTGNSSRGKDVEKVHKATYIVQKKRPDLIVDGPLQYDAAVIADIAKFKAPYSSVAGRANVFIFPDLNTGNITYKAVQRSANLISIGPMLQGMRKPVNDLSRGALVDDIVYTIALTVIQSLKQK